MTNRTSTTRQILAGLAALLIGLTLGCTAEDSDKPAPTTKAAPASVSPVASPAASITREAAAKQYLALVAPNNTKTNQCNEVSTFYANTYTDTALAKVKICYGELAKVTRVFAAQVRASQWPAELGADIEALARSLDAFAYAYEQIAKARTAEEYWSVQPPRDDGTADIVRARLGLPTRK